MTNWENLPRAARLDALEVATDRLRARAVLLSKEHLGRMSDKGRNEHDACLALAEKLEGME